MIPAKKKRKFVRMILCNALMFWDRIAYDNSLCNTSYVDQSIQIQI